MFETVECKCQLLNERHGLLFYQRFNEMAYYFLTNTGHSRDRSKGIEEMKQNVITSFKNSDEAIVFVDEIHLRYNRYRRDKLAILLSVIKKDSAFTNQALSICIREKVFNLVPMIFEMS